MEWVDLSVSSDSFQPANLDVLANSPGTRTADDASFTPANVNAAELSPRAVELLALAEHTVRWEDDVTPAELRLFESLYLDVLRQARLELQLSELDEPCQLGRDRTALLQLRAEACALVSRIARKRLALPKHWRRFAIPALSFALGGLLMSRDSLADTFDWGNLSEGKPWVASSSYRSDVPLSGVLDDFSEPFFFHTKLETNPWIEVDLGAETPAHSVTVRNRSDCCGNRAAPLVVETSLDHREWQVAATQRRSFSRWRVRLEDQPVRWVRLRSLRKTQLHLKAVVVRK